MQSNHQLGEEFVDIVGKATIELQETLARVDAHTIEALINAIHGARRLSVYGVGREGLAMKGWAMRLFHMGLEASVVGEMTASAVGPGDVFFVSAGPGYFSTAVALAGVAKKKYEHLFKLGILSVFCGGGWWLGSWLSRVPTQGARVVAFTSVSPAQLQVPADLVVCVPASCLPAAHSSDEHPENSTQPAAVIGSGYSPQLLQRQEASSTLPMGSRYELALQLLLDVVCMLLQPLVADTESDMKHRHTNME